MMNNLFKKEVQAIIDSIAKKEVLIVLKGFDYKTLGDEPANLEDLINNKMKYLMEIYNNGKKYVYYDEFIILRNNLQEIYKQIIIINNNLYINDYELFSYIPKEIIELLKEYFQLDYENSLDNFERIDEIEDYLNIFGTLYELDNKNYISYVSFFDKEDSIRFIDITHDSQELEKENIKNGENILEIIEEKDYISLLNSLSIDKTYYIRQFAMDLEVYKKKLELISALGFRLVYAVEERIGKEIENYDLYLEILNKYWKANNFHKVPNYDLEALARGEKKTYDVSQVEIIDSLVTEVEKAIKGETYRDIFVTAPTGSGKSAMFQIPAIYLGKKYNLMTIVISPLIGLMKDQVKGLEDRDYMFGRTINSDVSPVERKEIMEEINDGSCHILYISPETLLSRSDISQLIGDRKIGLFVVDEAHIVTTWGKQFRPDYWFLGDHVSKIKKKQREEFNQDFPIATFTATAIYGGIEDMYSETKISLNMPNPITYLGYIKRDNIEIMVKEVEAKRGREEYELDKFDSLLTNINKELFLGRKTLVYFPTVKLIDRFYEHLKFKKREKVVAKYNGQMSKVEKDANYEMFNSGEKTVMLATKAFGMGIDIDDIVTIMHFAPTGNVCDYIQEVGRAARKKELAGKALYEYMNNDFKHINRLHGISTIKKYQLIQVIEKILDLFNMKLTDPDDQERRKSRSLLLDTESFMHIFQNDFFDHDNAINKVKTAMLIIQKDFENRFGYSPIYMRPIPIFSRGYFKVDDETLKKMKREYGMHCSIKDKNQNIIDLNLEYIWENEFENQYTFPQFKYFLYIQDNRLNFKYKNKLSQVYIIDLDYQENYKVNFHNHVAGMEDIIYDLVRENKYYSSDEIAEIVKSKFRINIYKARIMVDSFLLTMKYYVSEHRKGLFGRLYTARTLKANEAKYQFKNPISEFFAWIKAKNRFLEEENIENKLYLESNSKVLGEMMLFLGLMESFDLLTFKSLGGNSSQIYLHITQTQNLSYIVKNPYKYKNMILEIVENRHKVSVKMLSFLFENEFTSQEIWTYIEDYFLGIIPEQVKEIL